MAHDLLGRPLVVEPVDDVLAKRRLAGQQTGFRTPGALVCLLMRCDAAIGAAPAIAKDFAANCCGS